MFRPHRVRPKGWSINRMIPNILTMFALCSGLTAIHFALAQKWEQSVLAIVVAAVFDGLDGRIARLLKGTSKFGAELDSLSDFISFGVAPALVLYLWALKDTTALGWVLVLLFATCCALRLARFNTDLENPERPVWAYNFFTGVPSPAGAGLVLLPLILSFEFGRGVVDHPAVVTVIMILVATLLVSRLPTFAFKQFKVPHNMVLPTMLFVGLLAALLVSAPWATLSAALAVYLISIPFAWRSYQKLKRQAEALQSADVPEEPTLSPQ